MYFRFLFVLTVLAIGSYVAPSSGGPALSADANNPLQLPLGCMAAGPGSEPHSPFFDTPMSLGCLGPSGFGMMTGSAAGAGSGSINGTVTEEGTGDLLSDACVIVVDSIGFFASYVRTGELGAYHVGDLPDGSYNVWAADCGTGGFHRPEWYDDAEDVAAAEPVVVAGGAKTAGIDLALSPEGGAISGFVTEAGTGMPISGACIFVTDLKGVTMSVAISNAGVYSAGGLPSGDYRVVIEGCFEPDLHVREWYDGASEFFAADVVSVFEGLTTPGIDASLQRGASLSGIVREQGSAIPLASICVSVFSSDGQWQGTGLTDSDGTYSVDGLPNGEHSVQFVDCESPRLHIVEWYDDEPDFSSADLITVGGPGSTTTGIDARLSRGGSIRGRVTEAGTGSPLADICVSAWSVDTEHGYFDETGLDGEYEVGGLPSGSYKIWFRDCAATASHPWEWHNNEDSFDDADPVVVRRSQTAVVDAVLVRGATINGTITETVTGEPLWGACVYVYDTDGSPSGFGWADALGRYSVGLSTFDTYKLWFQDCRLGFHADEWYQNEEYFDFADTVSTGSPGAKRAGINASLPQVGVGDADCDGSVSSVDAVFVLQFDAGLFTALTCFGAADVDESEDVTALDAVLILQFVAGLLPVLPV